VAGLLDTEKQVEGVTCGKVREELRGLGVLRKTDGGQIDSGAGDLDVTAGWGHGGQGGVCMPGKGKIGEKAQTDEELRSLLGEKTLDIYLNEKVFWSNVPEAVWDYTLGGYQVLKKWLSYRERTLLGRALKMEEAEYVTEVVRRIAALILLGPELDANYEAVKADTWPWKGPSS
jgi:hypothetical protein